MRRNKLGKKSVLLTVILLIAIVGVGVTIAISMAQSNQVTNTFQAGEIDTSIEEVVDGNLNKHVTVKNSDTAKSDAFVRVRINAPEGVTLKLDENASATWKSANDGFYYYLYSVAPNTSTTELLSEVEVEDDKLENFDVTVYHEACIATTEHRNTAGNTPLDVSEVQDAFTKATTSGAGN